MRSLIWQPMSGARSSVVRVELIVSHASDATGDFNQDGACDGIDLELLKKAMSQPFDGAYDVNGDQQIDLSDWQSMISEKLLTSYGDANLDRTFDSRDLILIFQASRADATLGNSPPMDRGRLERRRRIQFGRPDLRLSNGQVPFAVGHLRSCESTHAWDMTFDSWRACVKELTISICPTP